MSTSTLRTYTDSTTNCVSGSCSYSYTEATCAQGCLNGACVTCAVQGCTNGNQSRSGCSNARTIGRSVARQSPWFVATDNTCSASNNSEGPNVGTCWDYGRDHVYRIFLYAGESINVGLTEGSKCPAATSWDSVVKIYRGSSCTDTACGTKLTCDSTWTGFTKDYTAIQDGWHFVVVDGRTSAYDDSGTYTLTVKLTSCLHAGCDC
jgi:hypothetical protein